MTNPFDVPVALFVFARPDHFGKVLSVVRSVRPRLLLIVADGPRQGHPEDISRRRAVLDLIETVDWPCETRSCIAEQNLGCDRRLTSGLDWVFGQVAEAIILEDDIVPDPSFFPWCAAMLQRYRDEPTIMHISGHNELGCWGPGDSDHFVARRGSVSGWSTWARAWFGVDRTFHQTEMARRRLDRLALDPLLACHLSLLLDLVSAGALTTWDTNWSIAKALADGLSVIPPTNLVANIGFGALGTNSIDEADLRAALPRGSIARPASVGIKRVPDIDSQYDRWSLLLALMATYRNPAMARRLAGFPGGVADVRSGRKGAVPHHLAPFAVPEESIAVLKHLESVGVLAPRIAALRAELEITIEMGGAR
jgi:hypothetical protein